MTRLSILLFGILIILSGCAIHSGVVPIGQDTYMVSRQAATGFTGMGSLKADAFREASEYCVSQNKKIQVVNTNESQPPYVLGNFPRIEMQFMCLGEGDIELGRPKMKKGADVVIEQKGDVSVNVKTKDQSEKTKDVYTELLKLDDLKKKGIISEEEFEAQKKKLLNGN